MYLRGSKWNMTRRTRRRSNPWRVFFLVFIIGSIFYINQFVIPNTPGFAAPTPTPTTSPESYISEAEDLVEKGKFVQAIQAYQNAILADPLNKANYISLARLQVWAGKYEDALETADMALIGSENFSMAHAIRGWALNFMKDYLAAEAAVKRAIDLDPNNAAAHAYYAEILINQGGYSEIPKAIEESRKAYDLAPNSLEALRARGYVLFMTDNREESIEMYEAARDINKYIPDLWMYLGYNYKALGDYSTSVDMFMQANALNPSDSVPDLEISRLYFQQGAFPRAIQWAENAVNDDPTNPRRYGWLGIIYYRNGDYNEAARYLTTGIRGGTTEDGRVISGMPLDNSVAEYYWFYGLALAKATPNRCIEAIPVFQAMLSAVPDNETAVINAEAGLEICAEAVSSTSTSAPETTTP